MSEVSRDPAGSEAIHTQGVDYEQVGADYLQKRQLRARRRRVGAAGRARRRRTSSPATSRAGTSGSPRAAGAGCSSPPS